MSDPNQVPSLSISQRDMSEVLTQLQQGLTLITSGQWTDFTEADIGWAAVKACAALFDFNAFFSDQNVSETFLSTCLQYESAVRRAKELNYPFTLLNPATVSVNLTNPSSAYSVTIPANSSWSVNGVAFTNPDIIYVAPSTTSQLITLVQGTYYSVTVTASGADWYEIDLPVNASNIAVYVNSVLWTGGDSFVDVPTPNFYKIYRNTTGPSVVFGNRTDPAELATPQAGDQIVVTAILTLGAGGNMETTGLPVIPISILRDSENNDVTKNFSGATTSSAMYGTNSEPIESIRVNAPAYYSTQGRCVSAPDYTAFVNTVSGVTDALCIGGQEFNDYGKLYIFMYGESPYTLAPDMVTAVTAALQNKFMVTVDLVLPSERHVVKSSLGNWRI